MYSLSYNVSSNLINGSGQMVQLFNSRFFETNVCNYLSLTLISCQRKIADHNERPKPYTTIRRFLFENSSGYTTSLDRDDRESINLFLFACYLNTMKTWGNIAISAPKNIVDVRGTSFQRARGSNFRAYLVIYESTTNNFVKSLASLRFTYPRIASRRRSIRVDAKLAVTSWIRAKERACVSGEREAGGISRWGPF